MKPHTSYSRSGNPEFRYPQVLNSVFLSTSKEFSEMNITENDPKYHYGNTTLYHFYKNGMTLNLRTKMGEDTIVYAESPDTRKLFLGESIRKVTSKMKDVGYELEKI